MQEYLARRLILFIPTFLIASLAVFGVMRILPGDVALAILGGDEGDATSLQQLESLRQELGLTDPLHVQYGKWLWSMVNGEFGGRSLKDREPLSDIVGRRFPVSLQLTVLTILITILVAVPAGIIAAIKQDRWPDYWVRSVAIIGNALPNFWVALVIILLLAAFFSWTPPVIYKNLWDDPSAHLQKIIWPALVLAWGLSSNVCRITRSNMLEVLRQDYVRTARSKGLREGAVISRHALRNALIPVITISGLQLATLMGGTVVLESIFSIPGLGQGIVSAATTRDYPVIQSLAMLLVLKTLFINLIIDVVYVFVDPRITYS